MVEKRQAVVQPESCEHDQQKGRGKTYGCDLAGKLRVGLPGTKPRSHTGNETSHQSLLILPVQKWDLCNLFANKQYYTESISNSYQQFFIPEEKKKNPCKVLQFNDVLGGKSNTGQQYFKYKTLQ